MKPLIKKFIEIHLPVGVCNMRCSYCYVGRFSTTPSIPKYSPDEIRKAFSKKRLGGICIISICSDGETLMHSNIVSIIKGLLEEGHYVMVVTNGVLSLRIKELLNIDNKYLHALFFKISCHYEEMEKMNLLNTFFENVEMIRSSPCSYTIEYTTDDKSLDNFDSMQERCKKELHGVLPHINQPRDIRKSYWGVMSKYSWDNYIKKWEEKGFESAFFQYKKQFHGKKYKKFCYAGYRYLWVNLATGYSHQCYHQPKSQYFMDYKKRIQWLPVGEHCEASHCYAGHIFFTLGVTEPLDYGRFRPTYTIIRNRKDRDGEEWVKSSYKAVFDGKIEQKECSLFAKKIVNICNLLLKWKERLE